MSRSALALPFALLLPLAALGAAEPDASLEQFARAVGMKEGSWRTSVKLTAAEVEARPDADPADIARVKARIESNMGKVEETFECAGKGSGGFEMPGIILENKCSYSKAEAAGGRWTLISTCGDRAIDGAASFVAQGAYAPEAVTGRHDVDVTIKGVRVRAKLETSARFDGECRPPKPLVIVPVTD